MLNFLYSLIIFPVEQIIEACYVLFFRIFRNHGFSIIGVSVAISFILLPLYLLAEKQQRAEREKQKQMKGMKDNIKAVFKGDKQYMMLSALYRQHNYHPIHALCNSFSLFIQIPFFIAAWHFLSNLELLTGQPFLFINDLSAPDRFLWGINLLPILMVLINVVSGAIYTKGFPRGDKIQVYGIAVIFLALLYNSPSGMVLYWICNNLFSLAKNFIQKTKFSKQLIPILVSVFVLLLNIFLLFFHRGWIGIRINLALVLTCIPFFLFLCPLIIKKVKGLILRTRLFAQLCASYNKEPAKETGIFLLSTAILFLLAGVVIPSSLISSFTLGFIETFGSPFSFMLNTALSSLGIFFVAPLCIYWMLSKSTKMAKAMAVFAVIALVNTFVFSGNYGHLTLSFYFSDGVSSGKVLILLNLLVITIIAIFIPLLIQRFRKIMVSVLTVAVCACVLLGAINVAKVYRESKSFQVQFAKTEKRSGGIDEPVFRFSKTGRNVLVLVLDRAVSGFVPYIFDEKPHLHYSFSGFTWYKNSVAFGPFTIFGMPALLGGYEYTPLEMQRRKDVSLRDKQIEASFLLPRIFLDHEFNVTLVNPHFRIEGVDTSTFNNSHKLNITSIERKYDDLWLSNNENFTKAENVARTLESRLIRFSIFKFAPLPIRNLIYDGAGWWVKNVQPDIRFYIALAILPYVTKISEERFDSYTMVVSNLTHSPFFLQAPDYTPANRITYRGSGRFANEASYHANIAALLLLGKWFDFLKENEVYDNTRIIIVSDHGYNGGRLFPENADVVLSNREYLEAVTALLMVKDFDSRGPLSVNDSFMTHADVPLIALENIVENPINPWTGRLLEADKEDGVIITTSRLANLRRHSEYLFNINPNHWMHVHTNIFDPANWSMVSIEE
ncbi:MAG: membrane protein insertase YidC [Spirochaetes bacterium]|nr:membrane protein insertase YidC [Spirochaetota bacterium]